MTKNQKINLTFLSNNWIITLTATLVGVFAALYLNEIVSSRKLDNQKSIATENIFLEIEQNRESLEKNIKKLELMFGVVNFMDSHMDEEGQLISSPDRIANFKTKYPDVLKIEDSTKLDEQTYIYNGKVDLDFNISHINLTTIALNTLKNSGLTASYDFNCLMNLERLEKFTKETLQKEKKIVEEFFKTSENEMLEKLSVQLKTLISFEKTLLEFYSKSEENLKSCG